MIEPSRAGRRDTTIIAALRFEHAGPHDELAQDLATAEREEHLLELIDTALREDEFALHLQPIVSLRDDPSPDGGPLIVEVLIRLPTQEFGVLASHEFLDTAERNGRMPAIDRWVIRALLVWMQRNRDRWADANAVFSVNLSGKSVVRPDFRNYLEHCLDKSGLPLTSLRFEVAELDAGIAPQEFAALARIAHRSRLRSVGGQCRHRHRPLRFPARGERRHPQDRRLAGAGRLGRHRFARAASTAWCTWPTRSACARWRARWIPPAKLRAVTQLGVDYAQGFRVRRPKHIDDFEFLSTAASSSHRSAPAPERATLRRSATSARRRMRAS